ncbi:MAG: hypothetical protein KBC84_03735 [Proteobacteria bacterium]|nr:hypothetical protein [Pseudomonadota bacterium]
MFIPILLKPKYLSACNYFKKNDDWQSKFRDFVIFTFAISIMLGIHYGGIWVLHKGSTEKSYIFFHPSLLFGLMFVYLFALIVFSNISTALTSIYSSNDLDLVLSSPIKKSKFFIGKFVDISFSSSWITFIFVLPAIFAVARFYQASVSYYLWSLVLLIPYFGIATALGIVVSTLYVRYVLPCLTKIVRQILVLIIIIGFILISAKIYQSSTFNFSSSEDILKLISFLNVPNVIWLPSHWLSTALSNKLVSPQFSLLPYFGLLYSTFFSFFCLALLLINLLHFEAYSSSTNAKTLLQVNSGNSQRFFEKLFWFVSPQSRSLIVKDIKSLSRDSSQQMQLLMIGGIFLVYFYNYRLLHGLESQLGNNSNSWWKNFIFLINGYIETFVITAISLRFVFQSVSLEGSVFWVLQSSPLSTRKFLELKFNFWFYILSAVLGVVFGLGAYLSTFSILMFFVKLILTVVTSYGVVGLAIGLGAYYSNFSWEHSSQLIASFGSLVFMLSSVLLVSLDLIVVSFILLIFQAYDCDCQKLLYGSAIASSFLLLIYLNVKIKHLAIGYGENELIRRMN